MKILISKLAGAKHIQDFFKLHLSTKKKYCYYYSKISFVRVICNLSNVTTQD